MAGLDAGPMWNLPVIVGSLLVLKPLLTRKKLMHALFAIAAARVQMLSHQTHVGTLTSLFFHAHLNA